MCDTMHVRHGTSSATFPFRLSVTHAQCTRFMWKPWLMQERALKYIHINPSPFHPRTNKNRRISLLLISYCWHLRQAENLFVSSFFVLICMSQHYTSCLFIFLCPACLVQSVTLWKQKFLFCLLATGIPFFFLTGGARACHEKNQKRR